MRWLIGMAGLLAIGAVAPPAPRTIAPATFVEWKAENGPRTFRSGDVTVRVSVAGRNGESPPAMVVSAPGVAPLCVVNDDSIAHYASNIAIGPLVRGQPSSVIIQTYTGGAHCCMHIAVALRVGKAFRLVDMGAWDGDEIAWPIDVSGDGVADFVFRDQSFLYAFGSYAGSWPAPQVINIRALKPVTVSAEPAFRPLFAAELDEVRKACLEDGDELSGGACAGYLAVAARLGQFDAAWAKVARTKVMTGVMYPASCSEKPQPKPCYCDYASAVRAFLRNGGYIN